MKHLLIRLACSTLMIQAAHAQSYVGLTNLEKTALHQAFFVGPTTLKEIKAESLSVIGPLEFHDLKVAKETKITGPVLESDKGIFGPLTVIGPVSAKEIQCAQLDVTGPVTLTDFKVSGATIIIGPLTATQGTFQDLTLSADLLPIILQDVETKNILIKMNKIHEQVQTLRLKGKTIVKGDITFESGEGIIEKDKGAQIHGKVIGATEKLSEGK